MHVFWFFVLFLCVGCRFLVTLPTTFLSGGTRAHDGDKAVVPHDAPRVYLTIMGHGSPGWVANTKDQVLKVERTTSERGGLFTKPLDLSVDAYYTSGYVPAFANAEKAVFLA